MTISTNDKVNDFLLDIQSTSPDNFEIVISIRDIFLSGNSELVEDIKYGGLVFNMANTLIGGVFVYKKHISIELSDGASFIDDDSILEGGGKKRRHLKVYTHLDVVGKSAEYFIGQAVSSTA